MQYSVAASVMLSDLKQFIGVVHIYKNLSIIKFSNIICL